MVGRLVQQQHVGAGQQQAAQRDPAPLAARELAHVGIARRAAQRVHRDLDLALDVPGVGVVDLLLQLRLLCQQRVEVGVRIGHGVRDVLELLQQRRRRAHAFHDVAQHVLRGIELRLLLQEPDGDAVRRPGLAGEILVDAGHDAQQGRLAGAVMAEHADLGARQERQPDVLQDLPAARIDLGQALHDIDVLVGSHFIDIPCFSASGAVARQMCGPRPRLLASCARKDNPAGLFPSLPKTVPLPHLIAMLGPPGRLQPLDGRDAEGQADSRGSYRLGDPVHMPRPPIADAASPESDLTIAAGVEKGT